MNTLSLVYNPDQQQVLNHHQELLKAAEQERLASQAMKVSSDKPAHVHGLGLFRRMFANHRPQKFAKAA
jgi:hypothetical protein